MAVGSAGGKQPGARELVADAVAAPSGKLSGVAGERFGELEVDAADADRDVSSWRRRASLVKAATRLTGWA